MIYLCQMFLLLPSLLIRAQALSLTDTAARKSTQLTTNLVSVPEATVGLPYNLTLGTKPDGTSAGYSIRNVTALPDGLLMNGTTLYGVPQSQGRYQMGFLVVDAQTGQSLHNTLDLLVRNMQLQAPAMPEIYPNERFAVPLKVQGGVGEIHYKIQGADWVRVVNDTLVGAAPAAGNYTLPLVVEDDQHNSISPQINILVSNQMLLEPLNLSIPSSKPNFSQQFRVRGTHMPFTLNFGSLPACLSASGSRLVTQGACPKGTFTLSVDVLDSNNRSSHFIVNGTFFDSKDSVLMATLSKPPESQPLTDTNSPAPSKILPASDSANVSSAKTGPIDDLPAIFVAHNQHIPPRTVCSASQSERPLAGSGVITSISSGLKQFTVDTGLVLVVQPCTEKWTKPPKSELSLGDRVWWSGLADSYNPAVRLVLRLVELVPQQLYQP